MPIEAMNSRRRGRISIFVGRRGLRFGVYSKGYWLLYVVFFFSLNVIGSGTGDRLVTLLISEIRTCLSPYLYNLITRSMRTGPTRKIIADLGKELLLV